MRHQKQTSKTNPDTARADDLLRQIPYFVELDAPSLTDVARAMRPRDAQPGEHILIEGEPCKGLYVVIEGQVRLVKTSADGREQVLSVLGPGTTFNDVAVFDGEPNSETAVAVGPSRIGFIPLATMMALIDHHPGMARAALKLLAGRNRSLGRVVEDLALRDVTARVARLLLGCIGHQDHIVEKADFACAHITHHEIATMIGSVREVAQRALKELERDGAIALERTRIDIRDPRKLERWANVEGGG